MSAQIEQAARGNRDAMAAIVAEHYPAVYRFCARKVGIELGQDAAQETFIIAQKAIRKFDNRSKLSTWLFGIAHNACRNLARKRRIEMTYEHAWIDSPSPSSMGRGQGGGESANPESTLVDREALRKAMGRLTPEHREAVVLHELEELTYEEIASIVGVPVGTVKSRLFHAFAHLRRFLVEEQRA